MEGSALNIETRMKTITPKENLMRVLSGGNPEWMPACVHIANSNNLPGFLPKELLEHPLDRLRVSKFVGGDILYEIRSISSHMPKGFEIKTNREEDNSLSSTLLTPEGCLTEQVLFSHTPSPPYADIPQGYILPEPVVSKARRKHFINGPDDYRILRSYFNAQTFQANQKHIDSEMERVGDKGILILGGPSSPLYSLISSYAGIERLTYDMFDASREVESAMQAMQEAACRWYKIAAGTSCEVIRCTEDLDTKLISPDMFRQYAVPALKEYARICHMHGKLFVVHMCGHIREFLADIRDAGADAIHCLTTPPTGNTPIEEARRVLSGSTSAMIRIDPHLLLQGNGKQIDTSIAKVCDEVGGWHNVLLIIPCGRAPLWSIRQVIAQVHKRAQWTL